MVSANHIYGYISAFLHGLNVPLSARLIIIFTSFIALLGVGQIYLIYQKLTLSLFTCILAALPGFLTLLLVAAFLLGANFYSSNGIKADLVFYDDNLTVIQTKNGYYIIKNPLFDLTAYNRINKNASFILHDSNIVRYESLYIGCARPLTCVPKNKRKEIIVNIL